MAKQTINIGTTANDGTGTPLRDSFDIVNDNFNELYGKPDLSLVTNTLTLTKADGTTDTVDLAPYLDEDARAISSGTLNGGTGIVTFTRDDASTFTLDLSALLDNTNIVTSVNTQTGAVVLDSDDIAEGSTNLYDKTVALTEGSNISISGTYPNFTIAAQNLVTNTSAQALAAATSLSLVSNTLTLTKGDGTTDDVDLSPYLDEDARAIASGTIDGAGIVTFTRDDATTFTLDLSSLLDDTNLVTSVNTQVGAVVLDSDDIAEGSTNLYDQTVTLTPSTGMSITGTYPDFTIASVIEGNATHTGDVTGSTALTIADDVIDYANMGAEFTTSAVISASDVDFSSAAVFTKTLSANTTLTFSNVSTGMVKDLVITGDFTLTLPASVKTITGTYDGTVSNLIQIVSTNGSTEQWATISQEA